MQIDSRREKWTKMGSAPTHTTLSVRISILPRYEFSFVHLKGRVRRCADLFGLLTEKDSADQPVGGNSQAARAVIKGPIHAPCQKKDHPGLLAFAQYQEKLYGGRVKVSQSVA